LELSRGQGVVEAEPFEWFIETVQAVDIESVGVEAEEG